MLLTLVNPGWSKTLEFSEKCEIAPSILDIFLPSIHGFNHRINKSNSFNSSDVKKCVNPGLPQKRVDLSSFWNIINYECIQVFKHDFE